MTTPIAFLVAFAIACVLSLTRHPIFGLMAYVGVFYIHPPSRWWSDSVPSLRWSLLAAAATLGGILLHPSSRRFRPLFRNGFMVGLVLFTIWLIIQAPFALDSDMHSELISFFIKFSIAVGLIYKSIETEEHLRMFLWANVLGCLYFSWVAYTSYSGGRFESFGGPGFSDANYAALQVVIGTFCAAALVLAAPFRERIAAAAALPFLLNGVVTTISRSGFLSLTVGGIVFVTLSPPRWRIPVAGFALIALVGFASVAHDQYWKRISTILFAGEEVEGLDTGAGRVVLMKAQLEMFQEHPWGCGHRCTAVLSPYYLDAEYLSGTGENAARSSHNLFLTMLLEHGVVGAIFYLSYLIWLAFAMLRIRKRFAQAPLGRLMLCIIATLTAMTVAELFVDYVRLEARFWFVALLLVLFKLSEAEHADPRRSPRSAKPAAYAGTTL